MQNIVLKLVIILAVLGFSAFMLYPPQENVRLGKDLRGGVSLIYSVRMDPETSSRERQEMLGQVITVLKNRINPRGVLDISIEPLGDDRLEVIMPLPNQEVQELRRQFEADLETLLREAQIPAGRLDNALRFGTAVAEFGGDPESHRGRMIAQLQEAYDNLQEVRRRLAEAEAAGGEAAELSPLEQAVALAMIEYEDLRDQTLRMSLDRGRILRVLGLSKDAEIVRGADRRPQRDPETGQVVTRPSPRAVELNNIKSEFPQLAAAMDAATAAFDAYHAKRTGFDDPEDLKRLLRGAGVLEYRIAVRPGTEDVSVEELRNQLRERGPENTDSPVARWFEINDLGQWYNEPGELEWLQGDPEQYFAQRRDLVAAERDGRYYLLLYTTPQRSMTHDPATRRWSLRSAAKDIDQQGRPAVSFRLDASGGSLMARLSGPHVGEPMAIVLDGEVYSAPTLITQIGSRGQITGSFSPAEINYLIRVLAAGALEARLSENPIAENTLGPTIGEDNLRRGMEAFMWAIIAVAVFMVAYYFFAGTVAVFALLANGLLIFGVMSMMHGMFTLPGLAGIVLTIGMAVDANVLIYERIREELFSGDWDLRGAIRQGYNKALSTIIDANITNLIVCLVLYWTATTEVKGFAMTLSIGICATLFTTLFVTRQIYYLYTDFFNARSLHMLPTVVPAIHHFLEPAINWISLRKIFWTVSAVAVVGSIALISSRGVDLIDTELRGGVAATMRTALVDETDAPGGGRYWLQHVGPGSVEERVRALGEQVGDDPTTREGLIRREFQRASVLTVGPTRVNERGFVEAQSFQVKVANPRGLDDDEVSTDVIVRAVVEEFGDLLDVAPRLHFRGEGSRDHTPYTFPIERDELGANIDEPRYTDRITEYLGGVAVVIQDLDPAVQPDEIRSRIERMRGQPDFGNARGRDFAVFGLEAAEPGDRARGYRSVAIVVADPTFSFMRVDFDVWDRELAHTEWALASAALSQPPSLEQVASYSAQVAESLRAAAVVAVALSLLGILLYIWIRFGSLRYSGAAVAALLHDVTIALGILALTAFVSRTPVGAMLLIEEFRIDLGVVAALLTIIGYSLNDTIVILDRIRENRGKLALPSAAQINRSINQTISRTVLTSTTTIMAVGIMYIAGGSGIRAFAFTLLVGLIVGTYSSIAIAAPLVLRSTSERIIEGEEKGWKPEPEPVVM
jgi:SecD/SecF fusion protein